MRDVLTAKALDRAALIKGGDKQLALDLGVSVAILRLWCTGNVPMPGNVFLKIVDILSDEDLKELKGAAEIAPAGKI